MKSGPLNIFLNQARREKRYLDKIGGFKWFIWEWQWRCVIARP
jgi:hypothetical protein